MRHISILAITLLLNMGGYSVMAHDKSSGMAARADDNPEIGQVLDKNIPLLKSQKREEREKAILELRRELTARANKQEAPLPLEQRARLSKELIQIYNATTDKDFSHPDLRRGLIYDIGRFGDMKNAKPFIMRILETGTVDEKQQALPTLGAPGEIRGDDLYDKIKELTSRGIIEPQLRASLLIRIDKARAYPEILRVVKSTHDKTSFIYHARALQTYYREPQNYKHILPRLIELGLDKPNSFRRGNGLFWIDSALLAAYLDTAGDVDAVSILRLMSSHSALCGPGDAEVVIKKLGSTSPQVRALASDVLAKAAEQTQLTATIKIALQRALSSESDTAAKAHITSAIAYIENYQKAWKKLLERAEPRR